MSIQAIAWVLEHSLSEDTERLVLISIANHVDPNGENAWPLVRIIAREANCSERQVQRAIASLVRRGELEVVGRDPTALRADRAARRFRMTFIAAPRGVAHVTPCGVSPMSPRERHEVTPVVERGVTHVTPSSSAIEERARKIPDRPEP